MDKIGCVLAGESGYSERRCGHCQEGWGGTGRRCGIFPEGIRSSFGATDVQTQLMGQIPRNNNWPPNTEGATENQKRTIIFKPLKHQSWATPGSLDTRAPACALAWGDRHPRRGPAAPGESGWSLLKLACVRNWPLQVEKTFNWKRLLENQVWTCSHLEPERSGDWERAVHQRAVRTLEAPAWVWAPPHGGPSAGVPGHTVQTPVLLPRPELGQDKSLIWRPELPFQQDLWGWRLCLRRKHSITVSQLLRGTGEAGEGPKSQNVQAATADPGQASAQVSPGCTRAQPGHRCVCVTHMHTHTAKNETAETGRWSLLSPLESLRTKWDRPSSPKPETEPMA